MKGREGKGTGAPPHDLFARRPCREGEGRGGEGGEVRVGGRGGEGSGKLGGMFSHFTWGG